MSITIDMVVENIDLEHNVTLLRKMPDAKLRFALPVESVVDMFNYYVEHCIEHIEDLENYACIYPEIYYNENEDSFKQYYFTLNCADDDDSISDISFLLEELKRQFGVNFKNDCSLYNLFRVLLMDCSDYDIINETLIIKIYYETFIVSWIKDFINKYKYNV